MPDSIYEAGNVRQFRMKKFIKRLIKFAILKTFSRNRYFRDLTGIGYFGLNKLDRELSPYFSKNGFYVELGANDGIKQSNSLVLEKYSGWHGVLIEPHPEIFKNLIDNRSKKNVFYNFACVDFDYHLPTVPLLLCDLMTIQAHGKIGNMSAIEHAKSGEQHLSGKRIEEYDAPAASLQWILDNSNAPTRIDFLSLDVEGSEIQVLIGVDHKKYRFSYICVESRDILELTKYLKKENYKLIKSLAKYDFLFYSEI